jgi:hypothetical protein
LLSRILIIASMLDAVAGSAHVRTGQMIEYPARQIATFHAGEVLRRAVRGQNRRGKGFAGKLSELLAPKRRKKKN